MRLVVVEKCSFEAAATAVGFSGQTLRHWHARVAPKPAECGEGASPEELHEEIKRLRRELRRAELEREILPLDLSISWSHFSLSFRVRNGLSSDFSIAGISSFLVDPFDVVDHAE